MTVLKLFAIYGALFATVFFAQTSEYAGLLYFVAALLGMTLLGAHTKSANNDAAAA